MYLGLFRLVDHTQEKWSARRRDLTAHNKHKRQSFIPPAGLEPAIPKNEWPVTHILDSAAIRLSI
jgi:hypothetical protein